MRTLAFAALIPFSLAACVAEEPETSETTLALAIVDRGPGCAELGLGDRELLVDAPFAGSYTIDSSTLTLGFDDSGIFFFFTSNGLRLDGVLAHAGSRTLVWDFGTESNGWGSLFAPIDPVTGEMVPPEQISFCYDYDLLVNPNAYASYGVRHQWSITKTSADANLFLAAGQTFMAAYDVTVTPTGFSDAGLEIDGPVFVHNQSPFPTTLTSVTVAAGEIASTVTCPVAFPWVLAPGTTLECSYVTSVPDTGDRMVVVTVTTSDGLPGNTGSELASFSSHTTGTRQVDDCVEVTDDQIGFLGVVCAGQGARTFHYEMPIGPFETCGPFSVDNIASYTGLDTGTGGDALWTITGEADCAGGCTLTQGYWKTHGELGPAPYDDTWAQLPDGASTPFFLSGTTYHGALSTPTAGNPYWTLSRQYVAAEMNRRNGAAFADVRAAFLEATALFETYTPAQLRNKSFKNQVTALASILDDYNNGLLGPGHCDE